MSTLVPGVAPEDRESILAAKQGILDSETFTRCRTCPFFGRLLVGEKKDFACGRFAHGATFAQALGPCPKRPATNGLLALVVLAVEPDLLLHAA